MATIVAPGVTAPWLSLTTPAIEAVVTPWPATRSGGDDSQLHTKRRTPQSIRAPRAWAAHSSRQSRLKIMLSLQQIDPLVHSAVDCEMLSTRGGGLARVSIAPSVRFAGVTGD